MPLMNAEDLSPFPTMQVELRQIDTAADYNVSISPGFEESPRSRMSGKILADMSVAISEAPGSILLRYERTV